MSCWDKKTQTRVERNATDYPTRPAAAAKKIIIHAETRRRGERGDIPARHLFLSIRSAESLNSFLERYWRDMPARRGSTCRETRAASARKPGCSPL